MKVKDKIVWINVTPHDGIPRRVGAIPGESLLTAIKRHNIRGIPADCGGGDEEFPPWTIPQDYFSAGVQCTTCSVVIPSPWNEEIYKPHMEKAQISKSADPISEYSRPVSYTHLTLPTIYSV